MLQSTLLHLQPVADCCLPASHGSLAHAAALELFLRLDPDLARRLHQPGGRLPFTVSPLWGGQAERDRPLQLQADRYYRWRLTGLNQETAQLLRRVTPQIGGLRLGSAVFRIASVAGAPQAGEGAGSDSYAALQQRWIEQEPPRSVCLRFETPTTFRVGRYEQPFPQPRLVFGALVETWNAWAPTPLGDLRGLLEETVVLGNWRGETRRLQFEDFYLTGFVGRFTYLVPEPITELRRLLALLAEYAFYAGVGSKTAQGMGQVRWERDRERR